MPKIIRMAAAAAAFATLGAGAHAGTVEPTFLDDGVRVTDRIEGSQSASFDEQNWFVFDAVAGASVDIDINRLEAALDPIAFLYFGDVSGHDFEGAAPSPLTFLERQDDTENDALGGPWGDPRFTFVAQQTGRFSVRVASFSSGSGVGAAFEVIGTGIAPVPLPASALLLLGGLGAAAGVSRRRKG